MEKQAIRVRRVGTVTFGTVLVVIGILFLIHLAFPAFHYYVVYRFWPIILIMLGIEVLLGSRQKSYEVLNRQGEIVEQNKMVYDVPAILLMIVLVFFSMCMAMIDFAGSGANIIIQ